MRVRDLAGAAVAAGMAWATAGAALAQPAPAMSEAEAQGVKDAAKAAIDNYYRLFNAHEMKALPEQSFNAPWILLAPNGPQADLTKEQALARFEGSLKGLKESGWGRSVFTTENVCVLNAGAAIVSGYNTRYKADGSVMSVGGVTYLLGRTGDGWRIVSYTGTPRGKTVRCD